jgi:FdhD protein
MREMVATAQAEKCNQTNKLFISDYLSIEEPLEIRLGFDRQGKRIHKTVSITMRSPGNDEELAIGFLFTEGIIRDLSAIDEIKPCGPSIRGKTFQNVIRIELKPHLSLDLKRLERHFYTSSSCGVCGKTSIEALKQQTLYPLDLKIDPNKSRFAREAIHHLPETLRKSQKAFEKTGGLHASGLFHPDGGLFLSREDVGRHNALDKVIGYAFLHQLLPLDSSFLLVSGRVSFELVQKAAMAGIPILGAVGAPSSLAVELAKETNMTLLGFIRNESFNIYHGSWRIA